MPRSPSSASCLLALLCTLPACRNTSTSTAPDATADPPSLSLPSEVQTTASVCTLRTDYFRPLGESPLSLSGGAPPFATIGTRGQPATGLVPLHAELGMPADDTMPFWLRLISGAADLKVQTPRTFTIHAAVPLALGAFAGALATTRLEVIRVTGLEVEVQADAGPSVELIGGPLRARGQCARFAIERRDFIASAVVPGVKWKESPDGTLKRGKKIPLTTLPIGEPVARLDLQPTDNANVVVFEREKATDRAHIGWFGDQIMLHGWIPLGDLLPLAPVAKPAEPTPNKPADAPRPTAAERLSCPATVPLVARSGESRAKIGTLVASSAFEVLARDKGWAEVRLELPLFALAPGARLLVRESDLAACKKEERR